MNVWAIVIPNHKNSLYCYHQLKKSSEEVHNEFDIEKFPATTPEKVPYRLKKYQIEWNYPSKGKIYDEDTKLIKSAYAGNNEEARIACAISHFELWYHISRQSEGALILEHDAYFINKLDVNLQIPITSINSPLKATRKAQQYHQKVQQSKEAFALAPWIDNDKRIPQGLPGHSAYFIQPSAAQEMVELVYKYGLWPNDALMCKQLVSNLFVSKKYYTKVQNAISTTKS